MGGFRVSSYIISLDIIPTKKNDLESRNDFDVIYVGRVSPGHNPTKLKQLYQFNLLKGRHWVTAFGFARHSSASKILRAKARLQGRKRSKAGHLAHIFNVRVFEPTLPRNES